MPLLRPLLVIGTRPEAIKLAPVLAECRRREGMIEPLVCLTGQHDELVRPVLERICTCSARLITRSSSG